MDQNLLRQALLKSRLKFISVQILANEDHLAAFRLASFPFSLLGVGEQHVDSLENELLLHALDGQNTFGTEEVGALLSQQPRNPVIELLLNDFAFDINSNGRHTIVVLMVVAVFKECILHL